MQRDVDAVLKNIESFQPQNNEWLLLDDLLSELWTISAPPRVLPVLFNVFERFPNEDGAGVLWSIVHGVESLEYDYEPALRTSMLKQPSEMGELMIGRLERSRFRSDMP